MHKKKQYDKLPELTKQKIIKIYTLVKQKNSQNSGNNFSNNNNSNQSNTQNNGGGICSQLSNGSKYGCSNGPNSQTTQPQNSNANSSNPSMNNNNPANPSAQQQSPGNDRNESVGAQSYTPSNIPFTGGSVDLSKLNVPDFCKSSPDYGAKQGGGCFDMENTTPEVKETMALACAAINKLVPVISASRSGQKCGNGGAKASQHLSGRAVDIAILQLDKSDLQKVFEVFRKKNFNGYGCYGKKGQNDGDEVHLDHGPARRWGNDRSGDSWNPNECPPELFMAGYAQ